MSAANGFSDVGEAIALQQVNETAPDVFHYARAFVDERGVELHERGSEADFQIRVLRAEDTAGADDDVPPPVHALIQAGDAAIDERLDGLAGHRAGLVGEDFSRSGELQCVGLAGREVEAKAANAAIAEYDFCCYGHS